MGILAKVTLEIILDFDSLRKIRSDWMEFYSHAYNSDQYRERFDFDQLDAGSLKQRAITAGNTAGNYRAHKPITHSVEWISSLFNRIRIFALLLTLIVGAGLFGIFELVLEVTTFVESVILAQIPFDIWVLLMAYLHLLQMDEEFIQEFNKELRFGRDRIVRAERDSEKLFGFYLWNAGLCDNKKAPALLFLYLIRMLSESIYDRIVRGVLGNLDRYLDAEGFRDAFIGAYKHEKQKTQM